jgi:integrase
MKSAKQFTRWLVRDRRSSVDQLAYLSKLNVSTDRRHDRRALTSEEFARLVEAAHIGDVIEAIPGPDRAMLYVLAAWTGFRKGEVGSLTLRSFRLDDLPASAIVAACYSKRKRQDTQILHPEVVRRLKEWLVTKSDLGADDLLFPVCGRVPGGKERKTHKMMRLDLETARSKWIEEGATPAEKKCRAETDFLAYRNEDGLYADFHSNRHLFITSLERAGLSPKMAQTLARHSDVRLTLGVYTHIGLHDQTSAVYSLPAPPRVGGGPEADASVLRATGTNGPIPRNDSTERPQREVPTMVPRGAENGAQRLASKASRNATVCTDDPKDDGEDDDRTLVANPNAPRTSGTDLHQTASPCTQPKPVVMKISPTGIEPSIRALVLQGIRTVDTLEMTLRQRLAA